MSKSQIIPTSSVDSLQPPMPLNLPIAVHHPSGQIRQRLVTFLGRGVQAAVVIVFTLVAIALVVLSAMLMVMVEIEEHLLGRYRQSHRNQAPPPDEL